jgi:hypothetical protein
MKTMFGRLLPGVGSAGGGLPGGGFAKSSTEQGLSKPTSKPIQIEQTHREQTHREQTHREQTHREQTQSGLLKK